MSIWRSADDPQSDAPKPAGVGKSDSQRQNWPTAAEIDRRRFLSGSAAAIAVFALGCRDDTITRPSNTTFVPGMLGRASTLTATGPYLYSRTVTIDHTKVSGTQTAFTVAIAGTQATLATVANGGHVTSSSGYDVVFFSDAGLTVPLSFERTVYNATTGQHAFWVKIPTLSSTADTLIYMAYGCSTVTTDQQDRTNAWDASYVEVHNFGSGASFDGSDSTAAARSLTNNGSTATTDGIDGGITTSTSGTAERVASNPPFTAFPATIETYFYPTETTLTAVLVGVSTSTLGGPVFELSKRPSGVLRASWGDGTGFGDNVDSTALYTTGAWQSGAGVFVSDSDRSVYLNGAAGIRSTVHFAAGTAPNTTVLGARYGGGTRNHFFTGSLGQVRFSNVARSAGWLTTVDASTRGIATFYSLGSEVTRNASPYVNAGTDGTDPGVDWAAYSAQRAIAWSGDRRGATRNQYSGSYEGAAYPLWYADITYPTVTGSVISVTAGSFSSLQTAVNGAHAGDTIVVPAGYTYSGNLVLPVFTGADTSPGGNNVVTIVSSALASLPYGVRIIGPDEAFERGVTATNTTLLAKLRTPNRQPAVRAAVSSAGWRLVGMEIDVDPAYSPVSGDSYPRIVQFGDGNGGVGGQTLDSQVPKNMVLDRCYVHGRTDLTSRIGVALQCGQSYIIDSCVEEIHSRGEGDAQAIIGWNSNGKIAVINCWTQAGDENIAWGGADNSVGAYESVEVRWSVCNKPKRWQPTDPTYDSSNWQIKNSAEVKKVHKLLWEGCIHMHSWIGQQDGDSFVIKNELNETVTNGHTDDIIIRYCDLSHAALGVRIMGGTYPTDNYAVRRVIVAHCLLDDIGTAEWDPNGWQGKITQCASTIDCRFVHCTAFPGRMDGYMLQDGAPDANWNTNFVFRDCIFGPISFKTFDGAGQPEGSATLAVAAPGGSAHGNLLVGSSSSIMSGTPYTGNYFPTNIAAVKFTNFAGGDYSLKR